MMRVREINWSIITGLLETFPSGAYYGVPRGGAIIAGLLLMSRAGVTVVSRPEDAEYIIDDVIDSGATADRYMKQYPNCKFLALIKKESKEVWIKFPWEGQDSLSAREDVITRLLQTIGEDPERPGLKDTPRRVIKFYEEFLKYPEPSMTQFDGAACDEMVMQHDIPFYSLCEHHLLPFFGTATIGYIPSGKILGLSKLARVVRHYAQRLQTQEYLTNNIAEYLKIKLEPKGIGVILRASHLCMLMRGVEATGSYTTTQHFDGSLKTDMKARNEFLLQCKK